MAKSRDKLWLFRFLACLGIRIVTGDTLLVTRPNDNHSPNKPNKHANHFTITCNESTVQNGVCFCDKRVSSSSHVTMCTKTHGKARGTRNSLLVCIYALGFTVRALTYKHLPTEQISFGHGQSQKPALNVSL